MTGDEAREVVLALTDVTYGRGTTEILHGVSLQVRRGEHWAMLGPHGAGKSTILGFCGAETHPTSRACSSLITGRDCRPPARAGRGARYS